MDDQRAEIRLPKLLLQAEVAELLRCSCSHVTRLRLDGKLGYLRGRPVTIDEKDLETYVACAKRRRVLRKEKLKPRRGKRAAAQPETFEYVPTGEVPRPFALLTIAEAAMKFERTPRQIQYLCLRGRVPYIPGKPPLIDETDLVQHFETVRIAELAKVPPAPGTPEFEVLQDRKARERTRFRLLKIAIRRKVKRMKEMADR